jgi:hypothetical protein
VVKLSVGIDQRNFVSLGREFSAQRTRTPAGSRPRRFVSSLRDSRILALYPGLTPWADSMPPRERGFEALVFSRADIASRL